MDLLGRDAATWLLGFHHGMRGRTPGVMRKEREAYRIAVATAHQVLDGGAFNPLYLWDMQAIVKLLQEGMKHE